MEASRFRLWRFMHHAEHLAGGRLIKTEGGVYDTDSFQHAGDAKRCKLSGQYGLAPRRGDERLRSQVINLIGLGFLQGGNERTLVQKVAWNEFDLLVKVLDPFEDNRAAAANQPENAAVLFQQKLCQIGTVLT